MYRIKFPSGEVATIESSEALTEAVRNGSVTSYCFILHERSGQWLPIVRHPHYHQALTARAATPSGTAAEVPAILPDPVEAPAPAAPKNTAERTTQAALDVPDLDALLEMTEDPAAPAEPPAAAPARARGRSRELEFLYVPDAKAAGQPRTPPRTAGPPPRPAAANSASAPTSATKPVPAPKAEAPTAPKAEAPTAPRPEPSPALAPTVMRPAPVPVVHQPQPVLQSEPETPAAIEEESAAPVATLAPPVRRGAERYDYDLVDPVEAALNGPAPIELSDERPRNRVPGGSRRLFIAAGLVVALGGGLFAWSPWSGGTRVVAAASAAPSEEAEQVNDGAPAEAAFDMDTPAEEEPAFDIYSMPADDPSAARTSFGGTAAQAGAAIPEVPEPKAGVIPRAPRNLRVTVPVVGGGEDLDSLRLAQVKQAITQ